MSPYATPVDGDACCPSDSTYFSLVAALPVAFSMQGMFPAVVLVKNRNGFSIRFNRTEHLFFKMSGRVHDHDDRMSVVAVS